MRCPPERPVSSDEVDRGTVPPTFVADLGFRGHRLTAGDLGPHCGYPGGDDASTGVARRAVPRISSGA